METAGENKNCQEILTSDVDFCNQESKAEGVLKTNASYRWERKF